MLPGSAGQAPRVIEVTCGEDGKAVDTRTPSEKLRQLAEHDWRSGVISSKRRSLVVRAIASFIAVSSCALHLGKAACNNNDPWHNIVDLVFACGALVSLLSFPSAEQAS